MRCCLLLFPAFLNLGIALPWPGPQPTQSATSTATDVLTSYSGIAKDIYLQIITTGSGSGASTTLSKINSSFSLPSSQADTLATSSSVTPQPISTSTPSQVDTLVTSSSFTHQATSASLASTSGSRTFAQTSASSSAPSAFSAAGNTTSATASSKSTTLPVPAIAGIVGGIGVVVIVVGLCFLGRRRCCSGKNSHRRSIQLQSNNFSTQVFAPHPVVPMMQVPKIHTPRNEIPRTPQSGIAASSAAPRFDKRGVLITDGSPAKSAPSTKALISAAKESSKQKTTSSSGASTKSGSSSGTRAKKVRKPAVPSLAAGFSSK